MKKIYLTITVILVSISSWSQCETSATASDTVVCPGDSVELIASGPLTTLQTTFSAGNNHRGNMFDITAINEVTIDAFDAHPMGNTDFEIYYKVGTFVGSETNPGAWTLVGSANGVVAQPMGTPTPIPINVGVTIPAGQTYSFYVTSTNTAVSLNYTDGTLAGSVYASDGNIEFLEGAGMEYPFAGGGGIFSPRIWNGNIHYSVSGGGTTYSWSTGSTASIDTVTPTAPTTYYVDITPSGCPTVTDSVTIQMGLVPQVDLGSDTTVCSGVQVSLDAGNPGSTYSWNNGFFTGQVLSALAGTSYEVVVTSTDGCVDADTIEIFAQNPPSVDLGADQFICEGSLLTLDAGPGSSYAWNGGDSTQTIDVGAGMYSVTVTDAFGCSGSDDITIVETPLPSVAASADTTICVNQSVTIDAGAGHADYLWSTADTTQMINVDGATLGAGTYSFSVAVSDTNGCQAGDTVVVTIDECLGVDELANAGINVYPNPTNGIVKVELEGWNDETSLLLFNTDGKLVKTITSSSSNNTFDLTNFSNGAYVLEVRSKDRIGRVRLIKQ